MSSNRRRIAARRRKKRSGSLDEGEPEFIVVAKLRRPHGLRGEVLVSVLSDFPERIKVGVVFFLGPNHLPLTIKTRREQNQDILLSFEELSTREDFLPHRNKLLYARVEDLPELEQGEYYHHQLLGLRVLDEKAEDLGKVVDILVTGSNDVYVVRQPDNKELLLPAIPDVVQEIDLAKKLMHVRLIPGLKE